MKVGTTVRVVVAKKPVTFVVADILFEHHDKHSRVGNGQPAHDATRWAELLVVKTTKGRIALRASWETKWQGERPCYAWTVLPDEAAAAKFLESVLAMKHEEEPWGNCVNVAQCALKDLEWWDGIAEEA